MSERIVIITGASQGIGFAVAKKFLTKGDKAVILSTSEQKGRKSEEELKELGEVTWLKCDVSKMKDCQAAADFTMEKYGRIDVLVNSAGILSKRNSFLEVDLDDIRRVLDVNIMGTIQMISAVSKYMVKQGSGTVVNIGSIDGCMANTESVGYHASKGGVHMLTKALARELSGYGIRVVAIAPGWVNTEMVDENGATMGAPFHMKGRIVEPEEIAGAVYLMTLEEASAINGSIVMADDGYASFKGIDGGLRL